ncbi:MAG: RecX family transcriptional regulator [Rhodospirillaceae bacterium]|jgi:regulatory protein|nr:RecX family transcriptional regulator [Rhodospirillaceae bacterium]MBT5245811.1 RecX family transcriptional regulator [Rhodospirillaceae bacterium]MBT5561354.1 RecX family transcriptional regulator [Rhodospirillaceae bacterium]MBT6242594.1 RecX family transcriptional regulator [Rhodospirillaceae bacterium]MBT7136372.1 RecX family transcriptional regulator [Rhodospirillaceae bacterium]
MSELKYQNRRKKIPRKVSATSLDNAALYYLGRFATSSENLRRVLLRRVDRAARHHDTDRQGCAEMIDQLIKRYLESGLLDDVAYARAQGASLNRRGKSTRAIRGWLRQRFVPADIIDDTLTALAEELGELDLAAAIAYARKRRLGPYRKAAKPPANLEKELAALEKELAALARSGFSYGLAKRIVEATDIDELENAL